MTSESGMPDREAQPSLGLELEFALASLDSGDTHDARGVFARLSQRRQARAEVVRELHAGNQLLGLYNADGMFSVDNGFNNLEYAFCPVGPQFGHVDGSCLNHLAGIVHREVNEVIGVLAEDGAGVLNLSEHPAATIDADLYRRMCAPKPIYAHWVGDRGWRHDQGIDAKAQNGPTTGLCAGTAIGALNLSLWVAPAMIALFGNSPFEGGRVTGLHENRLTLWPRMFAQAKSAGDRRFHAPPADPFHDLAHYFQWMYGPGSAMQIVPAGVETYKGYGAMLRVDGDPSLLEFLAGGARQARPLGGGEPIQIAPCATHVEQQQFSQFLDARIRFLFRDAPPLDDLLAALHVPDGIETLFAAHCSDIYLEGRACGANFPDAELLGLPDTAIAASLVMAPAALQKGLLVNPGAWSRLSALAPWSALPALRAAAVEQGMDGAVQGLALRDFAALVVEEAARGLASDEQWMLAYPMHVLRTGHNGARRALNRYETLTGDAAERIRRIAAERIALPLPAPLAGCP